VIDKHGILNSLLSKTLYFHSEWIRLLPGQIIPLFPIICWYCHFFHTRLLPAFIIQLLKLTTYLFLILLKVIWSFSLPQQSVSNISASKCIYLILSNTSVTTSSAVQCGAKSYSEYGLISRSIVFLQVKPPLTHWEHLEYDRSQLSIIFNLIECSVDEIDEAGSIIVMWCHF